MNRFLEEVLMQKRGEIAAKARAHRVNELECRACDHPVRDFRGAVSRRGRASGAVIAEIKKKSPTVASFRQNGDVKRLAEIYEANGAAAISVVADERNFGTSLLDVGRIRRVTRLPILVKDFVIDGSQILEARAAGADAVLLIARVLNPETLARFLGLTRRLGMSALVECHDEPDLEKAVACEASVIGINNRDLLTLTVSLEPTRRLLGRLPADVVRVSESGISSRRDVESLRALGADAFLVGGALLRSDDPGRLSGETEEGGVR
jgi:indole-3-glycerol phosphate synthase